MLRKIKIEKYVIPKKNIRAKNNYFSATHTNGKNSENGFMLKSILTNFILEIFLKKNAEISQ